jgi:hypothetical protein
MSSIVARQGTLQSKYATLKYLSVILKDMSVLLGSQSWGFFSKQAQHLEDLSLELAPKIQQVEHR